MTQLRCTLGALLGLALAACGDDATVVSVNISYADDIMSPTAVHVLLTQDGNKVDESFPAPMVTNADGELVADRQYFKRYDIEGWADGEAKLVVELLDAQNVAFDTVESTFDVREHGAAAAYAQFKIDVTTSDTSSDSGASADASTDTSTASSASDASTSTTQITDASTSDAASTTEAGSSDSGSSDSGGGDSGSGDSGSDDSGAASGDGDASTSDAN